LVGQADRFLEGDAEDVPGDRAHRELQARVAADHRATTAGGTRGISRRGRAVTLRERHKEQRSDSAEGTSRGGETPADVRLLAEEGLYDQQ
jgi:hypothetical protein